MARDYVDGRPAGLVSRVEQRQPSRLKHKRFDNALCVLGVLRVLVHHAVNRRVALSVARVYVSATRHEQTAYLTLKLRDSQMQRRADIARASA